VRDEIAKALQWMVNNWRDDSKPAVTAARLSNHAGSLVNPARFTACVWILSELHLAVSV